MMLWILQFYIFREMGKTFLLTAIGLMVVLGLGGGIMNMIELEQVTAWQMLKLMGFVLPVSLALTLPIAALYSAATTYGRLSADNEFVACRSGGINILTLFAPTLVISLFSAAITFAFINFIIPKLIKNLSVLVQSDLEQIVVQGLKTPGGFPLVRDRYRLFAANAKVEARPDDPSAKCVRLDGVTFVETDGDDWVRSGSAHSVVLSFDTARDEPTVTADMYGVSLIDHHRHQSAELKDHQRLGPHPVPRRFSPKVKWLDLNELAHYRAQPDRWFGVWEQLERLRASACGARLYGRVIDDIMNHGRAVLGDQTVSFDLRADQIRQDPNDGRVQLEGHVQIHERSDKGQRTVMGDRAAVVAELGREPADSRAYLEVFDNVTITDPANPAKTVKRQHVKLDAFSLDPAMIAEVSGMGAEQLLADPELFAPGTEAAKRRDRTVGLRDQLLRDIDGVMYSRFAFSVSVFVLVILAAALGIIFRGAHVLTAFGVAFVPTLFVIVTIVAGRQMAEKPGTAILGLAVLWAGIVAVGGLDTLVLFRVLRR
ncbi:MAG: LptF/LptG family permease [Planctomycetota bacterium]